MKILLGVDFSRDSKTAIRLLSGVGFPPNSEVFLFHVTSGFQELRTLRRSRGLVEGLSSLREKISVRSQKLLSKLAEKFIAPGIKVHQLVEEGNARDEILSVLEKKQIDLVVLGTRGLSGVQRFLFGSVSEGVLHEAPCPVLVVRGTGRRAEGRFRVLLTTDGSSEAQAALEFLNHLTFPPGSQIILFHVREPTDYTVVQDDYGEVNLGASGAKDLTALSQDIQERVERARASLLKEAKKGITHRNVKVEKISTGYAAEEIINAVYRFRANLIVMGSRGLTGIKRQFLGSVSARVARHAPCSVLVVRQLPKSRKIRL